MKAIFLIMAALPLITQGPVQYAVPFLVKAPTCLGTSGPMRSVAFQKWSYTASMVHFTDWCLDRFKRSWMGSYMICNVDNGKIGTNHISESENMAVAQYEHDEAGKLQNIYSKVIDLNAQGKRGFKKNSEIDSTYKY